MHLAFPGHTMWGQMESGAVWRWGGDSLLLLLLQNVVRQCFLEHFPFLFMDHFEEPFHPYSWSLLMNETPVLRNRRMKSLRAFLH